MKFVIAADPFDDRNGGVIALHLLCHRLSEAGETALLWPSQPLLQAWRNPRRYLGWARYLLTGQRRRYRRGPFPNRLATRRDLDGAVVVYPEIVAGNPLGARHVVRWLLHRPGFHSGRVDYGADDLFFHYQDAFHDPALGDRRNRLALSWWNDEYRRWNYGERSGSCYLVKKGRGRPIVHDLRDSTLIDALSSREKAELFNSTAYFYTYDLHTMYARYAAFCGCIPIVVPQPGLAREQWTPHETERYGIAYGEEDIGWAVATRDRLLHQLTLDRAAEDAMLRSFVRTCQARFG